MDAQETADLDEQEAIDSLNGHQILLAQRGEGGLHVELDDGRTLIIIGVIGIISQKDAQLH